VAHLPEILSLSTFLIAFVEYSDTAAWPPGWDTPLKGQRGNVAETGKSAGHSDDIREYKRSDGSKSVVNDTVNSEIGFFQGYDWYCTYTNGLNIEGFFEEVFKYAN